MTAATVVQIIGWGVKAIQFIADLVSEGVKRAQEGNAPTLDELDQRLAEHQNTNRDARYAADIAAAEAKVREVAAREYDAELANELKNKKP